MYFQTAYLEKLLVESDVVTFDLNGLIIDDEPIQLKATNAALSPLEIQIDEAYWIANCVGRKPKQFLSRLLHENSIAFPINALIQKKDRNYSRLIIGCVHTVTREGILDLIKYLNRDLHKQVAIATSTTSEGVHLILGNQGLNLEDQFDFIICGDQVTHSKPDPEIYDQVKGYFGEDCNYLVFEDSQAGVISASDAQMKCVAVPNKYTANQDFSRAPVVIQNLSAQANIIRHPAYREDQSG